VTTFDQSLMADSFLIAARLRQAGINAACYPEPAKLSKQFKYGDRMGMRLAVVLGPEENGRGEAALKDLRSGEQRIVPQSNLEEEIRKLLA
jgi:histidyl-tRNA synthetase